MTDKFVVIGSEKCGWCDKVKKLLDENGIEFQWFNISRDLTMYSFLKHSGLTTVPQVFLNGNRIGGYEDTLAYLTNKGEE